MHIQHPQLVTIPGTVSQMRQQLAALPEVLDPFLIVVDASGLLLGWLDAQVLAFANAQLPAFEAHWQQSPLGGLQQMQHLQTIVIVDAEKRLVGIRSRHAPKLQTLQGIIMAGGEGERLRPLTADLPKPLLQVQGKSLLAHAMDKLYAAGVVSLSFCLHHAAEQIKQHITANLIAGMGADVILEHEPLGTIGGVRLAYSITEDLLVVNTDVMAEVNLQAMYEAFQASKADLMLLAVKYRQTLPYARLKLNNGLLTEIYEKPTETMLVNGGIYFIKRHLLQYIPEGVFHATQLIATAMENGYKVQCFETDAYWQDIGTPEDLKTAQDR